MHNVQETRDKRRPACFTYFTFCFVLCVMIIIPISHAAPVGTDQEMVNLISRNQSSGFKNDFVIKSNEIKKVRHDLPRSILVQSDIAQVPEKSGVDVGNEDKVNDDFLVKRVGNLQHIRSGDEKRMRSLIVKREGNDEEEEEEDEEGWNQGSSIFDTRSGSSGSSEVGNVADGIVPVQGPYMNLFDDVSDEKGKTEDPISAGIVADKALKPFKNWDEYIQHQRNSIRKATQKKSSGRTSPNDPADDDEDDGHFQYIMKTEDHFRALDKLFKAKNDSVQTFHSLLLFMKGQGKPFKIPQKPVKARHEKSPSKML